MNRRASRQVAELCDEGQSGGTSGGQLQRGGRAGLSGRGPPAQAPGAARCRRGGRRGQAGATGPHARPCQGPPACRTLQTPGPRPPPPVPAQATGRSSARAGVSGCRSQSRGGPDVCGFSPPGLWLSGAGDSPPGLRLSLTGAPRDRLPPRALHTRLLSPRRARRIPHGPLGTPETRRRGVPVSQMRRSGWERRVAPRGHGSRSPRPDVRALAGSPRCPVVSGRGSRHAAPPGPPHRPGSRNPRVCRPPSCLLSPELIVTSLPGDARATGAARSLISALPQRVLPICLDRRPGDEGTAEQTAPPPPVPRSPSMLVPPEEEARNLQVTAIGGRSRREPHAGTRPSPRPGLWLLVRRSSPPRRCFRARGGGSRIFSRHLVLGTGPRPAWRPAQPPRETEDRAGEPAS